MMTRSVSAIIFSSILFLSGCTNHSIIKSASERGKSECKLVLAQAKLVTQNSAVYRGLLAQVRGRIAQLGIKRLDDQNLRFWIEFVPLNPLEDPLGHPGVILKLYKSEKMIREDKLPDGQQHRVFEEPKGDFSAQDIWPNASKGIYWRQLEEKAISFAISREQFEAILKADGAAFVIQTHYDPIIVGINKANFEPLLEFKQQCLDH